MQLHFQLLDNGHITADQLLWAIRRNVEARPPVGQLAVECGFMGMGQVFDVLAQQQTEDRPFGELAVEMGYMTRGNVGEVMLKQMDSGPSVISLLVESGAVCQIVVDELKRMQRESRGSLAPANI